MAKRRKESALPPSPAPKPQARGWLSFAIDLVFFFLGLALVIGALFSYLTRPTVAYSVSADSGLARCRFRPTPVFDGEHLVNGPPHLHLATVSLIARWHQDRLRSHDVCYNAAKQGSVVGLPRLLRSLGLHRPQR